MTFTKGCNAKEKHYLWKGEDATYNSKHWWIRINWGRAKECEECHVLGKKKYEWANISGKYKRERSDWKQLCTSCHRKMDGGPQGEVNGQAKLNEKQVKVIKWWKIINPKIKAKQIKKVFPVVSIELINRILRGASWSHIKAN